MNSGTAGPAGPGREEAKERNFLSLAAEATHKHPFFSFRLISLQRRKQRGTEASPFRADWEETNCEGARRSLLPHGAPAPGGKAQRVKEKREREDTQAVT